MIRRRKKKEDRKEIKENFFEQYSKVEQAFSRFYKWISVWADRILFSQRYGKAVALLLAILVYAVVNISDDASSLFETRQVYTFYSQPVTVLVNEETYEVSGVPETVDVQLQGDINDLQMIRQQNNLNVVADLRQLGEGSSEIQLEVKNIPSRVVAFIESGNVNVVLKKKVTKTYTLGYDYVNLAQMDATYDLGEPQFDSDTVNVRASEDTLKQVSYVKALIDVKNVNGDFEVDAPLAAYNEKGEKLDVDIIPDVMHTKVTVTRPKKTVPIQIVAVGSMEDGLAIETCTASLNEITLYGKQSVLDKIDQIEVSLPVSGINSNRTLNMPITLPSGVTSADANQISIRVTVGKETSKKIENVSIQFTNQAKELDGKQITTNPKNVDVTVYGSEEMLQNIDKEDIIVTADLKGISTNGESKVTLKVTGKNRLVNYQLASNEVTVTVSN